MELKYAVREAGQWKWSQAAQGAVLEKVHCFSSAASSGSSSEGAHDAVREGSLPWVAIEGRDGVSGQRGVWVARCGALERLLEGVVSLSGIWLANARSKAFLSSCRFSSRCGR